MNSFLINPQAIRSKIDEEQFSGVVYVTFEGQPIFSHASGFQDREKKILNRIDTKFNLCSMSKMFTAVAIVQLAQLGKLAFEDPLQKYVYDYPNPEFRDVTIHQLLTHTAGTGDIFGPVFNENRELLKNPIDFVRVFGDRKLEFVPGERFAYSNYGYILLGIIIEKVTGLSYYDYIRQNLYQIASMHHSECYWKTDAIPNMAIGYIRTESGNFQSNFSQLPLRGTPTGGSYSTVKDLSAFANALQTYRLVNEEFYHLMTTGKVNTQDGQKYAYGFRDRNENGLHWFGHSGRAPGASTTFRIYPQFKSVIIVLSNKDHPVADQMADYLILNGIRSD